jgi:hypothetical protein
MHLKSTLLLFLSLCANQALAQEQPASNWHFSASAVYSVRSLDGSLVHQNAINPSSFGTMVATGDSTGVDDSKSVMFDAAVQYKKFGFGISHMPTNFTGSGYALVSAGTASSGAYTQTDLQTDVDVTMDLASVYYNFMQNQEHTVGIGAGFGQTNIDISVVPSIGSSLAFNGTEPFGFLNFHFSNREQRFLYGFSVNWINANFSGTQINYSDYKINLGYRITQDRVKTDVIAGYRNISFAIDFRDNDEALVTNLTLAGPFLGLRVSY